MILCLFIRRLHGDDENIRRLRRRRKVQPSGRHGLAQSVLKARLYNVNFPAVQLLHDRRLHIEAADLKARQCKGNGSRQTDVAAAHNFNFFHWEAPFPVDSLA